MAEKIQEYKKNKAEIPVTLEDTLSRFFCRNLESLESQGGIWKIKAEKQPGRYCLSHNERNECMIVRENSVITVIPYQELSSIPNMAVSALRKVMSDCNVTLSEYERVFETPLDKAKYLIDTFCESEYGSGADLSDLSKIPIAYTTLT
ncbi:MAG: hypothetical protein IJ555_07995, partial [Ruminococcus sp.]|nr:hypothetical protein [Ruminococcus sp.]